MTLDVLESLDIERAEQQGLGERRAETLEGLWAPLVKHLGERCDVGRLTVADVHRYEGQRRAEGPVGQTIRREVQALVRGLRLAKADRLIAALPFDPHELRKIRSDPANIAQSSKEWSAREIAKVLEHLTAKAVSNGIRDQLRFIQLTGLRITELKRLRWSWLDTRRRQLNVPAIDGAKTGEGGAIPLATEAIEIARRWRPSKSEGDRQLWAKGKPNRSLAVASKRASMRAVLTPRDIRAWYITQAGKTDPAAAQRLARHKNIATTSRYLHPDAKRIRAAASSAAKAAGVHTVGSPQRKAVRKK